MTRTIALRRGGAAVLAIGALALSTACGSSTPATDDTPAAPGTPETAVVPGLALPLDAARTSCESVLLPAYAKAVGLEAVAKERDGACVLNVKSQHGDFADSGGMEAWVITDADLPQEPAYAEERYESEKLPDIHENAYVEWGSDSADEPETVKVEAPVEGGRLVVLVMQYDDNTLAKATALALTEALVATA